MKQAVYLSVLIAAFSLGCDGSPGSPEGTMCDVADAEFAACAGADLGSPFSAECTDEESRSATLLLEQLDLSGCEGPSGGKADCFGWLWDPFGWCDDPIAPLGNEPAGSPARYPILLAHGFNTSTTNFWRFNDVDVALENDGHTVILGSVPPFDASSARAVFLADQVDTLLADTGAEKVNLVCFSQGGVDCRYLVSPGGLDYGDRVASLSMISAPNRGTAMGDAAIALLPDADTATGRTVDAVASWFGGTFSELADDSQFIAAMESMSEAGMADFNETVIDHPDVYYQSWAGYSYVGGLPNPRDTLENDCQDDFGDLRMLGGDTLRDIMDPLLVGGAAIVAHGTELRPNDGISTVTSSHWGTFRGCIPADHLDQVGQINDGGPDRRTGFDFLRFYRNIAFELAAMDY
jgi:triacylglycerol lipase